MRGFLDPSEVTQLRSHLDRFLLEVVPDHPSAEVYYEDQTRPETLKQIQHLERHDTCFAGLMFNSRFEALASELLDEPVRGKNLQYFNKAPGLNQPTPPHQDGHYFMLTPCVALTMWLAVEPVDEENGCVRYLPGSHRQELRPHRRSNTLGFSQFIPEYPSAQESAAELSMPAAAGDLLVHHAKTIHSAGANRSLDRGRRALGFIYYGTSASEDRVAHRTYRERLNQDLRHDGRI